MVNRINAQGYLASERVCVFRIINYRLAGRSMRVGSKKEENINKPYIISYKEI